MASLSLRVSQHLALTPQLQQSIRLLQLSTLELNQEIEQMLDDNPFLERDDEQAPREAFGLDHADTPKASDSSDAQAAATEDGIDGVAESWEGDGSVDLSPDDAEWGGDAPARQHSADHDTLDATELARQQESLSTHLHPQAATLRLSQTDRAVLHYLIENLNEDGYLTDSLESLAEALRGSQPAPDLDADELAHRLRMALSLLQSLEPVGVGARDLAECLVLQLKAQAPHGVTALQQRDIAIRLCHQPLALLAKRDFKRLAALLGEREAQVKAAMALLTRLEPKPARRFADVTRQLVVPDVLVTRTGSATAPQFKVVLNSEVMPRLRVHELYANALKGGKSGKAGKGEEHAGLQQRVQEARWLIKNIQQRFDTILRVSHAIVARQKNFFIHGELAMRPMVLREIADELGLHESTISRVTTHKYMSTPWGTFELKYFFGSGLETESGHNASSTAVRALIKQLVASENPAQPLSDNQLADMLQEQGIACARRTVAKYREALRIAPVALRKAL